FGRECRFNRAGVAAAALPGNEALVALVTAAHSTDLLPIPGRLQPGAVVDVDATLSPSLSSPRLFVLALDARTQEPPVSAGGRKLRRSVALASRRGCTGERL